MLKYATLAAFTLAVFMLAYVFYTKMQPMTPEEKHADWRRLAVESETPTRPPAYEQMQFNSKSKAVEIRAPAGSQKRRK